MSQGRDADRGAEARDGQRHVVQQENRGSEAPGVKFQDARHSFVHSLTDPLPEHPPTPGADMRSGTEGNNV